jgi:pentatricopeptide repeat protein
MTDFLGRLGNEDVFPLVVVSIVFASLLLVVLSIVIAVCVVKVRRVSAAFRLKQDMLDRGMSADEIKTVLEAG